MSEEGAQLRILAFGVRARRETYGNYADLAQNLSIRWNRRESQRFQDGRTLA